MDHLVWPAAKAHLYVLEAAHVKNVVGRSIIQRNKDALRELTSHQEILEDLHAGECGPAARDVAKAATGRWAALRKLAASEGVAPETLCDVPCNVQRFLHARAVPGASSSRAHSGWGTSEAATSTRAPSTTIPLETEDGQSTAACTETRCETLGQTEFPFVRTGPGHRMSNRQLDDLAAQLREQLDQEYTSLITSIEEVQALMEAEVTGSGPLPSRTDLETFMLAADAKLNESTNRTQDEDPVLHTLEADPSESLDQLNESSRIAASHEDELEPAALDAERDNVATAYDATDFALHVTPALTRDVRCSDGLQETCVSSVWIPILTSCMEESQRDSSSARPRWADFTSDSDHELVQQDVAAYSSERPPTTVARTRWADMSLECENDDISESTLQIFKAAADLQTSSAHGPAMIICSKCVRQLGRAAFSRRAWRQARGLGASATSRCTDSVVCLNCVSP